VAVGGNQLIAGSEKRKLTGDLPPRWRQQDLDIPTMKNRKGDGGGG
jgi:hypothetical protein